VLRNWKWPHWSRRKTHPAAAAVTDEPLDVVPGVAASGGWEAATLVADLDTPQVPFSLEVDEGVTVPVVLDHQNAAVVLETTQRARDTGRVRRRRSRRSITSAPSRPGREAGTDLMEPSGKALVYQDGVTVQARLYGPLNVETVPHFQEQLERSLRPHCRGLSLDLGAADYVDSDGIRWLQRLQRELAERDIDLCLAVREGSQTQRIFRLLQLDRTLRIHHYPSEAPAPAQAAPTGK